MTHDDEPSRLSIPVSNASVPEPMEEAILAGGRAWTPGGFVTDLIGMAAVCIGVKLPANTGCRRSEHCIVCTL